MRLVFNSLEGCKLKRASLITGTRQPPKHEGFSEKHQSGGYIIYGHADMYIALILNLEKGDSSTFKSTESAMNQPSATNLLDLKSQYCLIVTYEYI